MTEVLDGKSEYYTGEKNKKLLVHILQNGVEVTKPIKMKIYDQKVEWRKRQWPIIPTRFIVDSKGIHHQYVETNDVAVLTIHKDHNDMCMKCSGKMTIDARQARELGKRGVFHAIWGIDSTHMILLIIFAIGMMAAVGFGFYSYNQDTLHKTQLEASNAKVATLQNELALLKNPEPIVIGEN